MWDLWWTKWHWGSFSQSTSVSPANSHSTDCSLHTHHPSSGAGTIGQLVGDVPSGLSVTPSQETKKKLLISRTEICAQLKLENFIYHTNDVLCCVVQKGLQFYFNGYFINRDGF
jgi:hypothetical protein